jgi:hypothetical protein
MLHPNQATESTKDITSEQSLPSLTDLRSGLGDMPLGQNLTSKPTARESMAKSNKTLRQLVSQQGVNQSVIHNKRTAVSQKFSPWKQIYKNVGKTSHNFFAGNQSVLNHSTVNRPHRKEFDYQTQTQT